jgi:hypothetical protein
MSFTGWHKTCGFSAATPIPREFCAQEIIARFHSLLIARMHAHGGGALVFPAISEVATAPDLSVVDDDDRQLHSPTARDLSSQRPRSLDDLSVASGKTVSATGETDRARGQLE